MVKHMQTQSEKEAEEQFKISGRWKKEYGWVLVANVLYLLVFYFLMKIYS